MAQHACRESAATPLSSAEVIYLSAWHTTFFHASLSRSSATPWQCIVSTLQLVGACGFDTAAAYAAQLHTLYETSSAVRGEGDEAKTSKVRRVLQSVYAAWRRGGADCAMHNGPNGDSVRALSSQQRRRSWPQLFLLSAAVCVLSDRTSISVKDVLQYLFCTSETAAPTATTASSVSSEATLSQAQPSIESVAPSSTDAFARADWDWWVSMSQPILTAPVLQSNPSSCAGGVDSSQGDVLFELLLSTSSSSASSSSSSARTSALRQRRDESVRCTFYTARLYAALVVAGNAQSPISAVATLLIAYMMQDDCAVRQLLWSANADQAASAATHHRNTAGGAKEDTAVRLLRRARMRGVVAGVMEYVMHCTRQHMTGTIRALEEITTSMPVTLDRGRRNTARLATGTHEDTAAAAAATSRTRTRYSPVRCEDACHTVTVIAAQLESLHEEYGSPQATSQASSTAALLLARMVELLHRHDTSAIHDTAAASTAIGGGGGGSSCRGGVPPAATLATTVATEIVHVVHELLYTIVLGRGSIHMASRPVLHASSPNNHNSNNSHDRVDDSHSDNNSESSNDEDGNATSRHRMRVRVVGASASSAQAKVARVVENAVRWGGVVVTRRGLCLSEVDSMTHSVFPWLLQQLGYTWPWSVLLRQCRMLDKEQQQQMGPSGSSSQRHGKDSSSSPLLHASATYVRASVMWSSRLLMDTLLAALPRHTYATRIQHALPASYDRVLRDLVALGQSNTSSTNAMNSSKDDIDGKNAVAAVGEHGVTRVVECVYVTPAYYDNSAMAAVLDYFASAAPTGWTTEELERVLLSAVAILPITAQLRALAPAAEDRGDDDDQSAHGPSIIHSNMDDNNRGTGGVHDGDGVEGELSGGATGSRKRRRDDASRPAPSSRLGCVLSLERVAALEQRYSAELLLTALVIHTQLQTSSRVQQAYRAVAPLLTKLLFHVSQSSVGRGVRWVVAEEACAADPANPSPASAPPARFTREATLLMERVGYQLYPLEWLPDYVEMYTRSNPTSHDRLHVVDTWANRAAAATEMSSSSPLPYSAFAAVAHQLGLYLRTECHGGWSDASQCHPGGPRGSMLTPPAHVLQHTQLCGSTDDEAGKRVTGSHATSSPAGKSATSDMGERSRAWLRRERYLRDFMLGHFLTPRDSACVCEGALVGGSTRRVGGDGGAMQKAWRWFVSCSPHSRRRATHASNLDTTSRSGNNDTSDCSIEPTLNAEDADASHDTPANRTANSSTSSTTRMADGRSSRGEVGMICGDVHAGEEDGATRRAMEELSERLMNYGAASFIDVLQAKDMVLTMAQCLLPATTKLPRTTTPACALLLCAQEWCASMFGQVSRQVRWYNSCTVDAVPLCREMLRAVPRRLWSKMSTRRQVDTTLRRATARQGASSGSDAVRIVVEDETAGEHRDEEDVGEAEVDALLVHEWRVWKYWVARFGWAERRSSRAVDGPEERDDVWTAAQLLWYSPYFAAELLLD